MMKHTPGPWNYYEHETLRTVEPGVEEPEDAWIEIRDEGDIIVARLPGGSIYDAELIAAAPDLLEVLKKVAGPLQEYVDFLDGESYSSDDEDELLVLVQAAIAKAGES